VQYFFGLKLRTKVRIKEGGYNDEKNQNANKYSVFGIGFMLILVLGGWQLVFLTMVKLTEYLIIRCGYIYGIVPVLSVFMFIVAFRDLLLIFGGNGEGQCSPYLYSWEPLGAPSPSFFWRAPCPVF